MRALCGAIIAAGSLIGLGLVAIAIGMRYQYFSQYSQYDPNSYVHFKALDTPLMIALLATLIGVAIGLGIAFVGLAYHHHHRSLELHHLRTKGGTQERISV